MVDASANTCWRHGREVVEMLGRPWTLPWANYCLPRFHGIILILDDFEIQKSLPPLSKYVYAATPGLGSCSFTEWIVTMMGWVRWAVTLKNIQKPHTSGCLAFIICRIRIVLCPSPLMNYNRLTIKTNIACSWKTVDSEAWGLHLMGAAFSYGIRTRACVLVIFTSQVQPLILIKPIKRTKLH